MRLEIVSDRGLCAWCPLSRTSAFQIFRVKTSENLRTRPVEVARKTGLDKFDVPKLVFGLLAKRSRGLNLSVVFGRHPVIDKIIQEIANNAGDSVDLVRFLKLNVFAKIETERNLV